jgi:hypothetical protein
MRALVIALVALAARSAAADPSDTRLVVTGLLLAPPTYVLGVTTHEGSHALAAKLVGADVEELHLFPPGIDPHTHTFRFGWTYVTGLTTKADKILFYIAPKITDLALLGGFAAFAFTDAWPRNRYGGLVLTVLATGWWVDFSKDVVLFSPTNDVVKVLNLWCLTGWRGFAARLVYAGIVAGTGVVVAHGYVRLFDHSSTDVPPGIVLPVLTTAF